jgi:hypothetical protein
MACAVVQTLHTDPSNTGLQTSEASLFPNLPLIYILVLYYCLYPSGHVQWGGACAGLEKSFYVIIQLLKKRNLQWRNRYAGSYVLDGPWSAALHGKAAKNHSNRRPAATPANTLIKAPISYLVIPKTSISYRAIPINF